MLQILKEIIFHKKRGNPSLFFIFRNNYIKHFIIKKIYKVKTIIGLERRDKSIVKTTQKNLFFFLNNISNYSVEMHTKCIGRKGNNK